MKNLTKIASLPGSGGGCMSALPAEVNEQPEVWIDAQGRDVTEDLRKDLYGKKVQMKAAYFEEEKEEIDWSKIDLSGGFGC